MIDESFWEHAPPDFADRFITEINGIVLDEAKAVGRLLDWVGVAAMSPLRERMLILCAEYLSRTGQLPLDEALALGRDVMKGKRASDGEGA